ncbi:MAG: NAD-binding protein [Micromonosporaceae bacterium]
MRPLSRRRAPFVVCGDNPLAYRLIEDLTKKYGAEVRAIMPSRRRNYGPRIAEMSGVKVIESDRLDAATFRAAQVANARAVAFVEQDDVGNIHAALRCQEIKPDIRLVVRIFNTNLGHRLRELFHDCTYLSDSSIAAPSFVATALKKVAPNHVRLPDLTLHVTRRDGVPDEKVICDLADFIGRDGEDLVLAMADGIAEPLRRGGFRRLPHLVVWSWIRSVFSRKLRIAVAVLVGLLVVGSVTHGLVLDRPWYDALYFTLLTAAGGGDPDEGLSGVAKVIQTVMTLSGIALLPVVTAAVVDGVVGARLAVTVGRLRDSTESHVVVVGLGNVGSRVLIQLHDLGLPVVAVERDEQAIGVRIANERRIPVVLGDATQEATLRAAKVDDCRALVAVTSDDVKNLEAALHARQLRPDLRVVLRLFDGELASRIQSHFGIESRSVSFLAAPSFALAMVERKVFDSVPVGRWLLLFADFPVGRESYLDGRAVSAAHIPGKARVIALGEPGNHALWTPPQDRILSSGDRLIVLATREGVAQMIERTEAATDA